MPKHQMLPAQARFICSTCIFMPASYAQRAFSYPDLSSVQRYAVIISRQSTKREWCILIGSDKFQFNEAPVGGIQKTPRHRCKKGTQGDRKGTNIKAAKELPTNVWVSRQPTFKIMYKPNSSAHTSVDCWFKGCTSRTRVCNPLTAEQAHKHNRDTSRGVSKQTNNSPWKSKTCSAIFCII